MKNNKAHCIVGTIQPSKVLFTFLRFEKSLARVLLLLVFLLLTLCAFSQTKDSTKSVGHLTSVVSVTTKGISTIPTFTLGKPAAIFDLSIGTKRISFEPQFRFSLEGKPWSFLFWGRYKLLTTNKFQLNIGAHPALNFRTEYTNVDGAPKKVVVSRRYLAGEVVPNYSLTKNISAGLYYLYSRGLDEGTIKRTHFLGIRSNFSHIKLSSQYFVRFIPQLYYLKLDQKDGFYVTSTATLARKNFPFSLSAIINKNIHTHIVANKNFLWNVTLVYFFNKDYVEQKQAVF